MSKSEHGAFRFIFAGCQVGFHFVRLGSVEGVERRTGKFGGLVSFPKYVLSPDFIDNLS
jgi:hypothetical protein